MKLCFLTGAGASNDSGIRTYRGTDGIYTNNDVAMVNLSINRWRTYPQVVWGVLLTLLRQVRSNSPGPTYQLIKKLAEEHEVTIFTQNVDGYSKFATDQVCELHGNYEKITCEKCGKIYEIPDEIDDLDSVKCPICKEFCKPNVTLYGEDIKFHPLMKKKHFDQVIVIGTTMQFPYLDNMVAKWKQRGAKIFHINPDASYAINVGKNEKWIQDFSENGLKELFFPEQSD